MKYIGATETFDPAFVKDWDQHLKEANLIISKRLTDDMIQKLVKNKDKIIFHHTVTGFGGSVYEPGVQPYWHEATQASKLLQLGFPATQYVLRVDPVIPTNRRNIELVREVLTYWIEQVLKPNDVTKLRCRISIIDQYSHVAKRFMDAGMQIPWYGFHAPKEAFKVVAELISGFTSEYDFESCAELGFSGYDWINQKGCANLDDVLLLGLNPDDYEFPEQNQRAQCRCLAKKQILKVKPGRCSHKCIYCYWKD